VREIDVCVHHPLHNTTLTLILVRIVLTAAFVIVITLFMFQIRHRLFYIQQQQSGVVYKNEINNVEFRVRCE
jgi:hypothetical protein